MSENEGVEAIPGQPARSHASSPLAAPTGYDLSSDFKPLAEHTSVLQPAEPQLFPAHPQLLTSQEDASPLFHTWSYPPQPSHLPRIPHLGDLLILGGLVFIGWLASDLLTLAALRFHFGGVSTLAGANADIRYTLGNQFVFYALTFGGCLLAFPLFWHKSLLQGIHWNGATALKLRRKMFGAATVCFILALINGMLMPGPDNTPIDKIFRAPGAAWLLFAFGVTAAPFFEEIVFRGFLLPTMCTAADWVTERLRHQPPPPPDANGHPVWSMKAMIFSSIATSIPFALMHADQTAHALGPFLLLVCVSMVLCWARLSTRSLAASVLVHASYNFLLFTLMLFGTGGFRHLDKM